MDSPDPSPATSRWTRFAAEIRRRHVVRFSVGYAAAAFIVLQLAEILFPAFGIGEGGVRILVVVLGLGFPPAAVLAWLFDLTPRGLERTERHPGEGGLLLPRLALLFLTVAIVGSLGVWLGRQGAFEVAVASYDASRPVRSLAVLPLDDYSEDGERAYFTAGMHEELITQLSQLAGLRVVSRTTSARYAGTGLTVPEIGLELGVDALVEGSVVRSGGRMRITVQLIHAASDTHIWAESYDRELGDILDLQREVAYEIALSIRDLTEEEEQALRTRTAEREVDPDAADAYMRGMSEFAQGTTEGYRSAMERFQTALAADSSFAPALAGLAGARFLLGLEEPKDGEDIRTAYAEATRALELDSTSMEAREVLALIQESVPAMETTSPRPAPAPGVPGPAVPKLSDSIRVDAIAFDTTWGVASMTRLGERIEEEVRRATTTAAGAARERTALAARRLMVSGRNEEAANVLRGAVSDPSAGPGLWDLLVRAQISARDPEAAAGTVRRWSATGGAGAPTAEVAEALSAAVSREGIGGYWRWTLDRLERDLAEGAFVPPTELAAAHAAAGNTEAALSHLSRALEIRDPMLPLVRSDPAFDSLRADPRFIELVGRAESMRRSPRPPRPGGRYAP